MFYEIYRHKHEVELHIKHEDSHAICVLYHDNLLPNHAYVTV